MPEGEIKDSSADAHLRSTHQVSGYHVKASDGEIGHLEDFLFDDETWEIRYAIIDTKNWWPGKKVLLRPQWIVRVTWADREIEMNLTAGSSRTALLGIPTRPLAGNTSSASISTMTTRLIGLQTRTPKDSYSSQGVPLPPSCAGLT